MPLPNELLGTVFDYFDLSTLFVYVRPVCRRFYNESRLAAIRGLLLEDKIDYPIHVNIRLTSDIEEDDEVIAIINDFGQKVWSPPSRNRNHILRQHNKDAFKGGLVVVITGKAHVFTVLGHKLGRP
jgi:hypothetical protein